MNNENKKFLPFILENIFQIESSKSGIDKNKLNNNNGNIPYVTRTDKNNGIESFVGYQEKYEKNIGNVITIGLDTQTVFYQSANFYTGQNVQILYNNHLSFNIAMYLIPLLKVILKKFSWGSNGATLSRLKRSKIMLPVNDNGFPDYKYMEEYINSILFKELNDIKKYCKNRLAELEYKEISGLNEVNWKVFNLISSDLFYIDNVKVLKGTSSVSEDGIFDVVGATSKNNGNVGFLGNENTNLLTDGNCICLIKTGQGSVGDAVYKNNKFIPSNNVAVIRCNKLNKFIGLFIVNQINNQSNRYSYGYIRNSQRILNEKVLLPIDDNGKPNYGYMEQYIKNIMYNQYVRYISFLEK